MTALRLALAIACIVGTGCGSESAPAFPQPKPLVDLNDDPTIVEVRLVAEPGVLELLPGKSADVWTFRDGSVADSPASMPGPLLEANVGDRVIVHFENRLPVETTIHWHGLRVPNASDGTPIAQMIVVPGGTYDYTFTAAIDANTPRRKFVLDEKVAGLTEPTFSINGEMYPRSTPTAGTVGQIAIWEIENATEMDHPFHPHGMSFQVLDDAGLVVLRRGWKDTVNVPRTKTVRFAVRYETAGRWMYHCHILEHAERGMMGELDLRAP